MPTLLHIYGSLAIQTYGFFIVLGVLTGLFFIKKDKPLLQEIPFDQLLDLASLVILTSVIGGRLLYLAEQGTDSLLQAIAVWDGGLSVFGAILLNLIVIPLYLYYKKIPAMLVLDRIAIYIPLIHAIARLGCFFAGCCHGKPSTCWCAVTYTHLDSLAPLNTPLIPTQLFAAFGLLCIFLFLYSHRNKTYPHPGYFLGSYLYLSGTLRFLIDFLRADHIPRLFYFSHSQIIAWCIICIGLLIKNHALQTKKDRTTHS